MNPLLGNRHHCVSTIARAPLSRRDQRSRCYYLAVASFGAGLVFGVRGALLPAAGIAAFGAAALINRQPQAPGAENQTALIVGVFWIYFPAMFGALAVVGAGARLLARLAARRERS